MCLVHCDVVRNCTLLVSSFTTLYTGDMCSRKLYNFRFVLFHSLMPQDCMTALYSIGTRNFYMFFFIVISPLLRVEIRSVGCGRRVANCLWGGTGKAVCTRWNKEVARPCQRALPLPSSVYVEAVNQIFLLCAILSTSSFPLFALFHAPLVSFYFPLCSN